MNRSQGVVLAAAAAVLVITAGAGVAVWQRDEPAAAGAAPATAGTAPATAGAAPAVSGMRLAGDPIPVPGKGDWTQVVSADGRVYAAVEDNSNAEGTRVVAFDARTGKRLWTTKKRYGPMMDYGGPIAFPGGLLLSVNGVLHAVDPATGVERWKLRWHGHEKLVVDATTLARLTTPGAVEAYDLTTGRKRWSTPAGNRNVAGLQSGDYYRVPVTFGPATTFADDGLVLVTRDGGAEVRDMRTGKVRRAVAAGLPGADSVIAYRNRLFTGHQDNNGGPWQLRVTDLAGTGGTRDLHAMPRELEPLSFTPCGEDRICLGVLDRTANRSGAMMIDVNSGTAVTTTLVELHGGMGLEGSPGGVLVQDIGTSALFNRDGATVTAPPGEGHWIDHTDVLWKQGRDTLSAVNAGTGRMTELVKVPGGQVMFCALEPEFLACGVGLGDRYANELRIWRFTR